MVFPFSAAFNNHFEPSASSRFTLLPIVYKPATVYWRLGIAFLSSHEEPPETLGIVLRHAPPAQLCVCKFELRVGVALVRVSGHCSNFVWLIASRCRPIRLAKARWYDQQERDYGSDHKHDSRGNDVDARLA